MAIASPSTTKSSDALTMHNRQDEIESNNHFPKGFLDSALGRFAWKDASLNHIWDVLPLLPACLDFVDVMSADASTPSDGDVYLLDDNGATYTVSAINWQSGSTVRYTFSGSPDLSAIGVTNLLVCNSAVNSEHNGIFVITATNDANDTIDITNALITDAMLDETTGGIVETPHEDWNGATNNSWVRWSSADSVYYKIGPTSGQKCFDKTSLFTRTFDGTRWMGEAWSLGFAFSDEDTAFTTGTAKTTIHIPFKVRLTNIIVSLTTAPTGAALAVDFNDDGSTMLSTKVTVDVSEKTSSTAATPPVLSSNVIDADSLCTVDIDTIGSTVAGAGGKMFLIGHRV